MRPLALRTSLLLAAFVSACAGASSPAPPPPAPSGAPSPPTSLLQSSALPASSAAPDAGARPAPELTLTSAAEPSAPTPPASSPQITIELPYKLGHPPAALAPDSDGERARWNRGGRGEAAAPPPPPEGHPMPRVIIDVLRVKGPLPASEVQAIARRTMWIKVIGCYQLGAYKNQSMRGKTTLRLQASRSGKIRRASMTGTSLPDPAVAKCLANEMGALDLPGRKSASTITATIQVHPGDDPMPPPESAVTPGEGSLDPQEIRRVVADALPRLLPCYTQSLPLAPELWGRLALRLHVTSSGRVDEAVESGSTFPDPRAVQCILRAARTLEFPPPTSGDLRVIVPLRLSPR